jgi:hypothetical protein
MWSSVLVVLHELHHQVPLEQGNQPAGDGHPLRQDHADLVAMPVEDLLEWQLPPPESLPGLLGKLEVHPGIWWECGAGGQDRVLGRSGEVCHQALEPQADKPMEHKRVMCPERVCPHLVEQEVQECLPSGIKGYQDTKSNMDTTHMLTSEAKRTHHRAHK